MKKFDYAIERDRGTVEVHFTPNGRYDMPTELWAAIVAAAHNGIITWSAEGDDE